MQSVRRMIVPTVLYFAILVLAIFVAGWAREWLRLVGVPRGLVAPTELLIVAFALLPSSGFLIRAFDVPPDWQHRLGLGVCAVALSLLLDMALLEAIGRDWSDILHTHFGSVIGLMHSAALVFAAIIPLIRQRT